MGWPPARTASTRLLTIDQIAEHVQQLNAAVNKVLGNKDGKRPAIPPLSGTG